jgi:hypothetical protein
VADKLPAYQGELKSYTPTLREKLAYALQSGLGMSDDREGVRKAKMLATALEFSPVGLATAADDVTRSATRGDYVGAGIGLAMAGLPGPSPKIRAFHGSPHDFDKFSMDKIGTGEGAQAYGHGLYFAENEGVAKGYRDNLSQGGTLLNDVIYRLSRLDPAALTPASVKAHIDADPRMQGLGDNPEIISSVIEATRGSKLDGTYTPAAIKALSKLDDMVPNKGSMYEVEIAADPDQFLDWDKPLSEQPENVRKAIPEEIVTRAQGVLREGFPVTGGHAYKLMQNETPGVAGEVDRFRQAGIPGIKYLDQGSRAKGDGSRNYVVFDDKLINILRKYGISGLFAGGAAATAMGGNDAQASGISGMVPQGGGGW